VSSLRYGDRRTPNTEELQKQKSSNDNKTPILKYKKKEYFCF
jgi:hypothetical protein